MDTTLRIVMRQQQDRKPDPVRYQLQRHGAGRVTRLPRGERRRRIVSAASGFFAEEGFQGGTRALASRLGVTQALIYRYFPSKDALIEAVFEALAQEREAPSPTEFLYGEQPLGDRLGDLFVAYLDTFGSTDLRLMFRAALDGLDVFRRFEGLTNGQVARPTVSALRAEVELPGLDDRPMLFGEYELALALYGSVLFTAAQKVLGEEPAEGYEPILRMHARVFADGASQEVPRLHALPAENPLAQPVARPEGP